MTSVSFTSFMDLLGFLAATTAAIQLFKGGQRRHWPVYAIAGLTAVAYATRAGEPDLWTTRMYVAFEVAVGALAVLVGCVRPWAVQLVLFAGAGFGAWLTAPEYCPTAHVLLAIASLNAALITWESSPRDEVEKIARLGLSSLLVFQAARGLLGFSACEQPLLMAALSSAGWAVHVTAFGLIAWAARTHHP